MEKVMANRTDRKRSHNEDTTHAGASPTYDCAIVGAGPAGLSAAIYMGRMRRSVVVIDSKQGRSTWHQVNRNYLGFRDGIHATALREIGEEQESQFGVVFHDALASTVKMKGEGEARRFTLGTTDGQVVARSIILATGVSDKFPEFEGSEECIGKSMFWCIICDGYEATGKKIVVLGHGDRAATLALQLLAFTPHVTLVSWDEKLTIDGAKLDMLQEHGIAVHDSACNVYQCSAGQLSFVQLDDGTKLELDTLFVAQHMEPNNELAKQLNLRLDEHGFVLTDTEQVTNVEGVFAAGDLTKLNNHQVASAVHEGGMAAAAANYYLYEEWQRE